MNLMPARNPRCARFGQFGILFAQPGEFFIEPRVR
jgi:hypothetical protein